MLKSHLEKDTKLSTIKLFADVWGIGSQTANKLYAKGYRTLKDLEAHQEEELNYHQQVGLKYYYDFLKKIPRSEMEMHLQLVEQVTKSVDRTASVQLCGSYRRGRQYCGDIDMLVYIPENKEPYGVLRKILAKLKEVNYLQEQLEFTEAVGQVDWPHHFDKYLGVCKWIDISNTVLSQDNSNTSCSHPSSGHTEKISTPSNPASEDNDISINDNNNNSNTEDNKSNDNNNMAKETTTIHRRIDIFVCGSDTVAGVLMYLTGSMYFNRSIRYNAKKLGYYVCNHGIQRCNARGKKIEGTLFPVKSEKDIFDLLKLEYKEPHERDW